VARARSDELTTVANATTILAAGETARASQLAQVAADWARIGVWLSVTLAADPVDVEALIARTALVARDDERIFVGAASWLAAYRGWVNGRRLATVMVDLARSDPTASAVAGALLTLAAGHAAGPSTHPAPDRWRDRGHCSRWWNGSRPCARRCGRAHRSCIVDGGCGTTTRG
jgi:hypothetical protein